MSLLVIIRGPLAVGKSTIAKIVAKRLGGVYISVDDVLEKNNLSCKKASDGYIAEDALIAANTLVLPKIKAAPEENTISIVDGNFYRKSQIEDLIKRSRASSHKVFTLCAPLEVCISRDKERGETHGALAAEAVHKVTMSFQYGEHIDISNLSAMEAADKVCKRILKERQS